MAHRKGHKKKKQSTTTRKTRSSRGSRRSGSSRRKTYLYLQKQSKWIPGHVLAVYGDVMAIDELTELAMVAGKGDKDALALIVSMVSNEIRKMVNACLSHRPVCDKEDVYQDIMLRLCQSIATFQGRSAFVTWFNRLQNNAVADYYRQIYRHKEDLVGESDCFDKATEPDIDFIIHDLYKRFPHKYVTAIYKHDYEGYGFIELARLQNRSQDAVRSEYRRAVRYISRGLHDGNSTNTKQVSITQAHGV